MHTYQCRTHCRTHTTRTTLWCACVQHVESAPARANRMGTRKDPDIFSAAYTYKLAGVVKALLRHSPGMDSLTVRGIPLRFQDVVKITDVRPTHCISSYHYFVHVKHATKTLLLFLPAGLDLRQLHVCLHIATRPAHRVYVDMHPCVN
jgi:hypothetical protein